MSASATLTTSVHRLLDEAESVLREPYGARIPELRGRLDGPLRVAIAGKVKAGKSTLLNALVGEKVAPTDASECTRVVTWYRNSHVYRVTAAMFEGPPVELPFRRTERALEIDLDRSAGPRRSSTSTSSGRSKRLQDIVLIDTPGLASISDDVSRRTERFLASDEEGPGTPTPSSTSCATSTRWTCRSSRRSGTPRRRRGAVNSIAVLSRADEIGSSRTNALQAAATGRRALPDRSPDRLAVPGRRAGRRPDRAGRGDAARGRGGVVRTIAGLPRDAVTDLLLSAHRFVRPDAPGPIDAAARQTLLDRLGLFGVRLAVELIDRRAGDVDRRARAPSSSGAAASSSCATCSPGSSPHARRCSRPARRWRRCTALAELHGGAAGRRLRDLARDIENADHQLVEIRLLSQLQVGPVRLRGDGARGPAHPRR